MHNKGLCETCLNDKTCIFERKFPVIFCEEFAVDQPGKAENKKKRNKTKLIVTKI